MKYLLLILLCIGCHAKVKRVQEISKPDTVINYIKVTDTLYLNAPVPPPNNFKQLKTINDSLYTKLLLSNYKVEKVKYYLGICDRNPSQKKFLFGWMKRAVQ